MAPFSDADRQRCRLPGQSRSAPLLGSFRGSESGLLDPPASPASNPASSAAPPYNPRQLALAPGTRLGVYEVTAPIGEGGMGQVFRARDTTLNRDVALKVLPDSFANDPDRLARFTREAHTLASLNHPNIAHIHGLEESGGVRALVMELVEGDDLSQRIARGAISIDEALPIAKQIAEALEAAHEQNIIHRDLKPANIKVRPDGTVKVLDFGLSKATGPSSEASGDAPTMRSPAMTQAGMILGTAAYMSPEQARGKTVDKRADIWAFGCVLHEMLTGTRLFAADSVPETLGLIFSREPDLTTLPTATPARVRTLIARCLVKDPRQRMRDIGEARLALDAVNDTSGAVQSSPVAALWRWVPWGVAAAVALVAAWALWGQTRPATTAPQVTHLEIGYPRDVEPSSTTSTAPAISPDGRSVAMIGVKDGVRRVFLRRLDRAVATELPDTAGANGAVFSPDSRSLAVLLGSGLITRIALADQQRKVLTSGADIGRLDHLESGRHHLHPRGWALDHPAGGRRTARAHGARRRPPRGVARQRGRSARGAPRVVFESDHRPRRRSHRIRVDRRGTALGGGRAGEDSRVVAHWPSALREGRRDTGGGFRPGHGDAARHGHPDHAGRRD